MRLRRMLRFLFALFPFVMQAQPWVQLPNFPGSKRDDGVAVVVDGKAFFGTGLQEWNATIDFYALDLIAKTWSPIATMPHTTERQYACAFSGPGCFYITCGDGQGGALTSTYKYTLGTNTWATVSPKPGAGLVAASCMNFGDKIIIAGGKFQNNNLSNEVWEYTISNDSWLRKNDFPFTPTWRASSCVANNTGYMMFGIDSAFAYRKQLYSYNLQTDTWQIISQFPLTNGRAYAAVQATQNNLFFFGGIDSLNNYFNDSWHYYPATGQWQQGIDLPAVARKGGMSCTANGNFIYSCGIAATGRLVETWITDIPVAIDEQNLSHSYSIYPNPADDNITITGTPGVEKIQLIISDLSGRTLVNYGDFSNSTSIDLSSLEAGIYFLKIERENEVQVIKVIKR